MSLVETQWEFMKDLAKLINFIENKEWVVTGGELWRPFFTQQYYVKTGKSKTLNSYHLKRLAIDLNFFKPISEKEVKRVHGVVYIKGKPYKLTWKVEDIKPFGEYWESLSPKNRWGGNFRTFKDVPHFEKHL